MYYIVYDCTHTFDNRKVIVEQTFFWNSIRIVLILLGILEFAFILKKKMPEILDVLQNGLVVIVIWYI